MNKTCFSVLAACTLLSSSVVNLKADSAVTVDPSAPWTGYMNVYDLSHGFVFGSSWGTSDLVAYYTGPVLTLAPNTIGDPNSFWYTPSGGPGALGNKIMDANFYVETTGTFSGNLNFSANVLSYTLAATAPNGVPWTSVAFIKDFAADYSSSTSVTANLANGNFSLNYNVTDPTHHIQYGFETIGSDIWITDVAPFGNVQIAPVPEPTTLALIGVGSLGALAFRRRK